MKLQNQLRKYATEEVTEETQKLKLTEAPAEEVTEEPVAEEVATEEVVEETPVAEEVAD